MTVKCVKNKFYSRNDFNFDNEETVKPKDNQLKLRRPIKNWKKAWSEHEDDFEDLEEFN